MDNPHDRNPFAKEYEEFHRFMPRESNDHIPTLFLAYQVMKLREGLEGMAVLEADDADTP